MKTKRDAQILKEEIQHQLKNMTGFERRQAIADIEKLKDFILAGELPQDKYDEIRGRLARPAIQANEMPTELQEAIFELIKRGGEMNTTLATPNGRGCGFRAKGGVYLCTGQSMFGSPIEKFVLDPARLWPEDFQRGFKIIPTKYGHNNVIIFVGQLKDKEEGGYPSPWDFVEEVRHFGASRKVPPTFPFHQLTPGKSDMIFVHPKAYIAAHELDFQLEREVPMKGCSFYNSDQWAVTTPGWHPKVEKLTACTFAHRDLAFCFHRDGPVDDNLQFEVQMPSFSYTGQVPIVRSSDYDMLIDRMLPGAFLKLKLTHIEFPFRPNLKAQEAANRAGFETIVLDY